MKAERSALDPRKKKTEIPNRKLVWLSVNCSYSHSSLALPLLHAASVGIGGWEWSVLETTLEADRAETALELAARKPDLVCATLYLFNRDAVMEILERLHALMPECRIAVGGPECLGEGAREILDCCPFVGTVFRGVAVFRRTLPRVRMGTDPGDALRTAAFFRALFPGGVSGCRNSPLRSRFSRRIGRPDRMESIHPRQFG